MNGVEKWPAHIVFPHSLFMIDQSKEFTVPSSLMSATGSLVPHWEFMTLQSSEFTMPSPLRSADLVPPPEKSAWICSGVSA
jgi:hypothetical protein